MTASIVWFRQDLRLADNPALLAACQRGAPIIPLYIESSAEEGAWPAGGATRWWLHRSLSALDDSLREYGSRISYCRGPALETMLALCNETGADAVFWNRRYEPAAMARDTQLKEALRARGLVAESRNGALLVEPWQTMTQTGGPYQVFTPFWRRLLAEQTPPAPEGRPKILPVPSRWPQTLPLAALELLPKVNWYSNMAKTWMPGELGAAQRLQQFVDGQLNYYADRRDRPALPGTSMLSPHLHHGEVSPRQVWHAVLSAAARTGIAAAEARSGKFIVELIWREFSYYLLYHFPHTPTVPLRDSFARFPWREDLRSLQDWQRGRTGIPLVDAGMRELWSTGWMHNRVRMIAASFLVKNLQQPWLDGARWFWDTLVDADLASNTQGWQWTAGCGADAAPYFRVFNPVTQSQRFDPQGVYLRRWLPELARLSDKAIHAPWLADASELADAGVQLGRNYPLPVVDLKDSRTAALAAFKSLRSTDD